jgi:hypothetical protein
MRLLILLAFIAFGTAQAQSLYMPRNVKQAYQKGTRSMDGKPGKKYWQNTARYAITINATPPNRTIKGTSTTARIRSQPCYTN